MSFNAIFNDCFVYTVLTKTSILIANHISSCVMVKKRSNLHLHRLYALGSSQRKWRLCTNNLKWAIHSLYVIYFLVTTDFRKLVNNILRKIFIILLKYLFAINNITYFVIIFKKYFFIPLYLLLIVTFSHTIFHNQYECFRTEEIQNNSVDF